MEAREGAPDLSVSFGVNTMPGATGASPDRSEIMPSDPTPYDIEPGPAPQTPSAASSPGVRALDDEPAEPANSPRVRLLNPEDEDAFDDQEEARAAKAAAAKVSGADAAAPDADAFVKPGLGPAKAWGIAGAVILLAAVVVAAINAGERPVVAALIVVYSGLVHTGTGVVAVWAASMIHKQRLGSVEVAAARMLTAVAAFELVYSLNIVIAGTGKWEEFILGSVVYILTVLGLFRYWDNRLWAITGFHTLIWLIFQAGMELHAAMARGVIPPKP